jgi:hypothetical protein
MIDEQKTIDLLVVEDNEKHIADAIAEIQRRVNAGEKINVDVARDLSEYFNLIQKKSYAGIVSDIFFPSDREKPWDNLASNMVWDILGREYCQRHRDDYMCGDQRRENMFKMVQDDWMDGKELAPAGVVVADESLKKGIPIVLCTDTYHHGIKTQPVFEYTIEKGICVVDSCEAKDGNSQNKDWKIAFDEVIKRIGGK